MNKERNCPSYAPFGDRLRKMRHKCGLTLENLYDIIASDVTKQPWDESKRKTARGWETGQKKSNDIQALKRICKALDCSADYLLGLDECTTKENQYIYETTGLNETAINEMKRLTEDELYVLNYIFGEQRLFPNLLSSIVESVGFIHSNVTLHGDYELGDLYNHEFIQEYIPKYLTDSMVREALKSEFDGILKEVFNDEYFKKIAREKLFTRIRKRHEIKKQELEMRKKKLENLTESDKIQMKNQLEKERKDILNS